MQLNLKFVLFLSINKSCGLLLVKHFLLCVGFAALPSLVAKAPGWSLPPGKISALIPCPVLPQRKNTCPFPPFLPVLKVGWPSARVSTVPGTLGSAQAIALHRRQGVHCSVTSVLPSGLSFSDWGLLASLQPWDRDGLGHCAPSSLIRREADAHPGSVLPFQPAALLDWGGGAGQAVEGAAVSQACGKPELTLKAAVCRQRGLPPPRAGQQADIYPPTALRLTKCRGWSCENGHLAAV